MKEAQQKLAAAEEASRRAAEEAKKKAREIKTAVGLARTIGPHVPSWTTHRGMGAFCVGDFTRIRTNTGDSDQAKAVINENSQEEVNSSASSPPETTESVPTSHKTGGMTNGQEADEEHGQNSENTERENLTKGIDDETVQGSEKGLSEKENVSDKEDQIGETTVNLPTGSDIEKVIHQEQEADGQVHCETEASEMAEHKSTATVAGEKPEHMPTRVEDE